MITAMKAPKQTLQDFNEETAQMGKDKIVLAYPDDLLQKKTILDARLAMSENDSKYLCVMPVITEIFASTIESKNFISPRRETPNSNTKYFGKSF